MCGPRRPPWAPEDQRDQEQCDRWEEYKDHNPYQIGADKPHYGAIGVAHRRCLIHCVDDEEVHTNRWCDKPDFDNDQHEDPEPDRHMLRCHAEIKLADHRKENRDGQQDHREAVHEAAKTR